MTYWDGILNPDFNTPINIQITTRIGQMDSASAIEWKLAERLHGMLV